MLKTFGNKCLNSGFGPQQDQKLTPLGAKNSIFYEKYEILSSGSKASEQLSFAKDGLKSLEKLQK
jgi:hypothetical protein